MFDDRRQLQTVYVQMQIDTKIVIFDPFRQKSGRMCTKFRTAVFMMDLLKCDGFFGSRLKFALSLWAVAVPVA